MFGNSCCAFKIEGLGNAPQSFPPTFPNEDKFDRVARRPDSRATTLDVSARPNLAGLPLARTAVGLWQAAAGMSRPARSPSGSSWNAAGVARESGVLTAVTGTQHEYTLLLPDPDRVQDYAGCPAVVVLPDAGGTPDDHLGLAELLQAHGIASLLVGLAPLGHGRDSHQVNVAAAVDHCRWLQKRSFAGHVGIDVSRIVVAGHGCGGPIALRAAATMAAVVPLSKSVPRAVGVLLLSPTGAWGTAGGPPNCNLCCLRGDVSPRDNRRKVHGRRCHLPAPSLAPEKFCVRGTEGIQLNVVPTAQVLPQFVLPEEGGGRAFSLVELPGCPHARFAVDQLPADSRRDLKPEMYLDMFLREQFAAATNTPPAQQPLFLSIFCFSPFFRCVL